MKKQAKRWLAMFLCLVMTLSLLPAMAVSAFAEEATGVTGTNDPQDADVPKDEEGAQQDAVGTDAAQDGTDAAQDGEDASQDDSSADVPGDEENTVYYTVSGTVTDEEGKALEGVAVSTGSYTTTTDAQGVYTLELPSLEGSYTLFLSKEGYEDGTLENVTVTAENVSGKDIQLKPEKTQSDEAQVYEALPDGALVDQWKQDPQTVRGTGSICEITGDGHLHLKAGNGNTNNGDQWTGETTGTGPAVFISELMKEDLQPDGNIYTVSFKVKPLVDGICFGVYVNYKNPNGGMLMGYNTPGAWFWQKYGGGGAWSPDGSLTGPDLTANTTYDVELTWNPTAKTYTYKMGETGGALTAVVTDQSYAEVADAEAIGVINNIGIKLGKSNTGVIGEVEVWDLHYSGQTDERTPITTYTVSGVVTDNGQVENPAAKAAGDPVVVAGAAVTLSGADNFEKTATTNAEGKYSFTGVKAGTYTLTVTAANFNDAEATVTVTDADVTENVGLSRKASQVLPDDGMSDDWVRDTQGDDSKTNNTGSVCEKTDQGVHLKSGSQDGNGHAQNAPNQWPGMFYNETANEKLAAATGNRWVEFTFVRAEGSNPRFGVILNYENPYTGYFVGCNTDSSGWFCEDYTAGTWTDGAGTTPAAGKETTIYVEWNNTTLVSFKQDGTELYRNQTLSGAGKGIAFRLTTYNSTPNEVYIKEMHYSGQKETTVYNVSGKVTDGTDPLEGVTVTAGKYTATTAANGKYNLLLPASDSDYTITATKDGYEDGTKTVKVVNTALTVEDIALQKLATVSGTVTEKGTSTPIPGAAVTLTKTDDDTVVKTGATKADGTYTIIGVPNGTYSVKVSCEGYKDNTTVDNVEVSNYENKTNVNASLEASTIDSETLETNGMTVQVATGFPQVIKYTMKSDNSVMWGQSTALDTLKLNGKDVVPTVTYELDKLSTHKTINYTMTVDETNNGDTGLNVVITAHIEVGIEENDYTLGFFLDDVTYAGDTLEAKAANRLANPLETIEIPNHSLVSVRSTDADEVAFTGGRPGGSTYTSGDATYKVVPADETNMNLSWSGDFFAGFVYNDKFSAGLASNSEYGSGSGGSNNYPVRVTFEPKNNGAVESVGLSSTLWYWDRKVSSVNSGVWENAYIPEAKKVIGPTDSEKGYAKVSIAVDDQNNDKTVDWQDGAIVYRDTVMHKPANSGADGTGLVGIRDAVSMRINLNFGSQAQHPFLMSLDNVKRMALSTDGLGQLILMKGYAGEGHDSNHPDYWDIGERMGGVDDFNTMLEEGAKLGAQFGIHVNASEFYPEAQAFDDKTVGRSGSTLNEDGEVVPGALRYGWNWIDQGINMNVLYDFASGNRANRFKQLYDKVGNRLSFVYVDVWGNNQHGVGEDAWMTRKLTNEITENTTWRIAHEWSYCNPYDSTFQHWTSDYTYGNGNYKGHNNSNVMRFLLNSYRDSFPADFATFGGACNAPLLGGPSMQGFEGWQKDDEYDLAVENTFNQMIATKFLQHFDIVQWVNADNEVTIPYNLNANGARTSTDKKWKPEMQITLTDGAKNVVVTRGLDSELDATATFDINDEAAYRSRVITYDGKVILKGAPASAGEDKAFPESKATQEYLIPWFWDANGVKTTDPAKVKLYHWNAQGGEETGAVEWDVSYIWDGQSSAILYELSDQGRINPQTLTITGGKITLPASIKANTGYVVVLDENNKGPEFEWSTGLHVKDASFNIDLPNSDWTATGTATRVRNPGGISALELDGEASVKQDMTDLTAGQKYVAYVGVDNLSNTKAAITIADKATGEVLASNYTLESIAVNYISGYGLHTAAGLATTGGFREGRESRFQNMYVFFTPEAGKTYTMTLSHEGEGKAYFAGVRVLETAADNIEYDAEGNITKFTQDFEYVAQGMYPFVVAGIEGVEDNRQHLSELHAPYTQAGWDKKLMDDVLEGDWSVKVNGLTQRNTLVFQTIPQNVRFEPGVTYIVSFKYQMGSPGIYKVVIGDGKYTNLNSLKQIDLEQGMGPDKDKTCTFVITGSATGQTWFGIYSTGVAPTVNDSFTGHKEIVVDNLVIQRSTVDRTALNAAIETALAMNLDDYVPAEDVTETEEALFGALASALEAAQVVQVDPKAGQDEVDTAKDALIAAMAKLARIEVTVSGTVTDENGAPVAGATVTLEDSNYMPVGNDVEMPGSAEDGSANHESNVKRGYTWHKGLTATTGADGKYSFASTEDVFLGVDAYKVKVQKDGYNVTTVDASVTKTAPNGTGDAVLFAEAEAVYTNNFDGGDVSKIGPFDNWINEDGTIKDGLDYGVWYTMHNDSPAATTRFRSWDDSVMPSSNGRKANNMLVKEALAKIANGTISFDVTLPDSPVRFGITLRGATDEQRIYIGQGSSSRIWFVEWWNAGDNSWSSNYSVPIGMDTGVTRRVKITMQDSNYTVWIDGVQILEGEFDAGAPTDEGFFGINMQGISGTNWNSRAIVDNIRVSTVDYSELRALYGKLSGEENADNYYTADSWEAFRTALTEANTVLEKDNATQAEIDTARRNLQDAFDGLTHHVDVTGVEVLKDGVAVDENTLLRVYTNNDHDGHDHNHSLTLTANVLPEDASNKGVNWKRDTVSGMVALSRNGNELTVTAIHNEAETNVGEVKLNVYAEADETVYQPITVQVFRVLENDVTISIQGVQDSSAAPKYGQTLEADINQLKMTQAGKDALTYQWTRSRDGKPTVISGANAKTYTLTAEDIGAIISVHVTADESTYYEGTRSATRSQPVEKADGPNITGGAIYGVKTTGVNSNDGKIVGFGTDFDRYEYWGRTDTTWKTVPGLEITGLAAGQYRVRIKETATHKAGTAINVTVPAFDTDYRMVSIDANMVNGTVTRSMDQAEPETPITLTVRPDTGYKLKAGSLTVTGASGKVEINKGDGVTEDGKTYETYLFRLPGEDVTVSAEFEKLTFTIDHSGLVNLKCSKDTTGEQDSHEVEYGDTAAITLVPVSEYYTLPAGETIEIIKTGTDDEKITGWTFDRTTGTITITGGVTSNLTIKARGVEKTYAVNYALADGLSAPETNAPRQVKHKAAYTGKLVAAEGYTLPDSITVTKGGKEFTDFTYENGTLTIGEGKIDGNLVIATAGTVITYEVGYSLTNGLSAPDAPNEVDHNVAYTATLVAGSGYKLPNSITVTMDGNEFDGFTYNSATGVITIPAGRITGNLFITASGVRPVSGVTLNQSEVTLLVSGFTTLVADVSPDDATDKTVTWSSSDESVATVVNGTVTAVAAGEATITVTTNDGGKTATCHILVEEPAPGEIVVSAADVNVKHDGQPHSITVTVTIPATGASVTYATAQDGEYTDENPEFTEVGTYTVYFKVEATGYTTKFGSAKVVITEGEPPAVDKTDLTTAITDAKKAKEGVEVKPDGTDAADVAKGTKFVTQAEMDALNAAITNAQALADKADANQDEVNAAVTALNEVVKTFNAAIKTGTKEDVPPTVDKTDLTAAITDAKKAKEGIVTGTTAANVAQGTKFVTQAEMDALNTAIDNAQTVADKANATQAEVDAAVTTLNEAVKTFNAAIKTGTYTPSVPTVPSKPPTTTTVEKNEDGSTTTTVTDNKTGTVTETTEKADGTKEIVETKKDGTVTQTIEKTDGTKQIVETKKDGTVTQTVEKTDGSKEIVETKKDGTITETKVDSEGAKAEKVTDPEKNTEIKVTDATGEVVAEVKLPAEVPAPETRFEDVPEGHWADEAVHEMAGLGIVNGVGGNQFDMNSGIKRGDLALMLARLSNAKTEDVTTAFTDVPAGKYYAGGVAWAAKNGIVTGRSADTFDPEATITRGELALMLYRYAKLLKMDTSASGDELDSFTDGASTPDWAADGLAWCIKAGLVRGREDKTLDPMTNITRAEAAVMIQRFVALMK